MCFEVSEDEWRIREIDPGSLLSLLSGLHEGITSVVLDPLPEMVAGETLGLVNVSRREFMEGLLNRKSPFRTARGQAR